MTAGLTVTAPSDPLATLREYHALAPWGLRDLAALAAGILDASGVVPVNAAARARPSERTIRFYVARGLVSPPDGRGTAAVYSSANSCASGITASAVWWKNPGSVASADIATVFQQRSRRSHRSSFPKSPATSIGSCSSCYPRSD